MAYLHLYRFFCWVLAAGVAGVDFVDPTKAGKAIDWDAPLGKGQRPANGAPNSATQGQH